MKYKQDPHLNVNVTVGIAERPSPPVLTILLAILYIVVYYFYQSANSQTWIMRNTFQVDQVVNLINNHNYGQICNILFFANFSNVSLWQLLISIYFTSLFGIPTEKRLGPSRFVGLVLFACTLPWVVQFVDVYRLPLWRLSFEFPKQSVYFFGTYSIMLALAGAYTVLQPQKEKDLSGSRLHRRDRMEIFNKKEAKAMNERFGLSPNLFFGAFIVYAIVSHFGMGYLYKGFDTIGLYAGLFALFGGFIQSSLIHMGLQDSYQEHPLKHAAIKQYYELLDLDVGHVNAVKGAAKGLGVPADQVEDWVKKTKGKLRPT